MFPTETSRLGRGMAVVGRTSACLDVDSLLSESEIAVLRQKTRSWMEFGFGFGLGLDANVLILFSRQSVYFRMHLHTSR